MVGKKQKPGMSRMDAATDAMGALGFPKADVVERVNLLLTNYGGEEYWRFIEEDGYRVLLENLLDEPKDATLDNEDQKDDDSSPHEEIDGVEEVVVSMERPATYGQIRHEREKEDDYEDDEYLFYAETIPEEPTEQEGAGRSPQRKRSRGGGPILIGNNSNNLGVSLGNGGESEIVREREKRKVTPSRHLKHPYVSYERKGKK